MTRIKKLIARIRGMFTPRVVTRIRLSNVNPLRLEEWRRSPSMVGESQRVLSSPVVRAMIDVLHGESPSNYGLPELGVRSEDRAAMQAKIEGYHLCLNNLESMKEPIQNKPPVEATFESPEPEV